MSFPLVILWLLLVVGVNSRAYDYGMFDNFFTASRSPSNDGSASERDNTPALLKGEDVVQKILGARILMPTQNQPTHDLPTESRTQIDFTTVDTPTIIDYAEQLLGQKRPINLESFNDLEIPTRSQRPIEEFPQETHDTQLPLSMNPLTDTRAVPTRLSFDNEPITLYEHEDRHLPDYGILTRNPSRTPDTTLDDWYMPKIVEQTFEEPVLRGLTAWAANETITPLLPEDMARRGKGRKRITTTTPRKTKPKRRRTTTTTPTTVNTFTPPCYDTMGYRIRCHNTTTATTFTTEHFTTLPPPTTTTTTTANFTNFTEESTTTTTPFSTTVTTTTAITTTTTTPTLSTPTLSDIDQLLAILDNLTYIYDINLVEVFNETLVEEGYPYCKTTLSPPTTEPVTWAMDNFTGTVINKCYVCGMETEGLPRNSDCADAFASDFFPMSPVDFTSRRHMDRYRKQCRYIDMPKWHVNGTRGRSMWGQWTGGCAVRWMDISGVYTQRTCRNRRRPALGRHLVSKRMAKLEYSLFKEDNGCIISPQASLVPFSRGISLYARFHACVCTGNYCNRAERVATLCMRRMVAFCLVVVYFR